MHYDDRLATVLRHRATGERAARTQYRQLLDLLGQREAGRDQSLEAAAFLRLKALGELVAPRERARIIEDGGARIRNAALVEALAEAEPDVAAAALSRARLTGSEWTELIPDLPIRARGFLRHRRDLPGEAVTLLDRLGVSDRGLPEPEEMELGEAFMLVDSGEDESAGDPGLNDAEAAEPIELAEAVQAPAEIAATAESAPAQDSKSEIGALVQRIAAFQKSRDAAPAAEHGGRAPQLPLGGETGAARTRRAEHFAFATDVENRIIWADPEVAAMVVGTLLGAQLHEGESPAAVRQLQNRLPVEAARAQLGGSPRIEGAWIVDAVPSFTRLDGRFEGYIGQFRRPSSASAQSRAASEADRIRELLHELRTPVNAIQGFAEVIQQQLFGAVPHEYRALAAGIAGDSARMLAGFDELDRLVKLEGGVIELDEGACDFAAILKAQVEQLQTVLSSRVARMTPDWQAGTAPLAMAAGEAEMLAWRLLATIASATGAGEEVALTLAEEDEGRVLLTCRLPAALSASDDIFSTETRAIGGALSPGIFGAGFALRLARAEARSAGGDLTRSDSSVVLTLPLLTGAEGNPSPARAPGSATG